MKTEKNLSIDNLTGKDILSENLFKKVENKNITKILNIIITIPKSHRTLIIYLLSFYH
jgi:hypothetical protein